MKPVTPESEDTLLRLLAAARDDNNSTARTTLNAILRNDAAARALMARLLVDEHALVARLRQEKIVAAMEMPRRENMQRAGNMRLPATVRPGNSPAWMAIAAMIILALALWFHAHRIPNNGQDMRAVPVAVLAQEAEAVWRQTALASGAALQPGRLHLLSGMAAIEFTSGARVLLEGPADFEMVSGMESICHAGKLRVQVPPSAQGFIIRTPAARVVDLGTAFGLSVHEDGSTMLKVMQGEVKIRHRMAERIMVKEAAVALTSRGEIRSTAAIPDAAFPTEENFNDRLAAGERRGAQRWHAAVRALAADPATLLSFPFFEASSSSRAVRNHAGTASLDSYGTLVGAGWTRGRWRDKRALEFNGRSDGLLFRLNHTAPATTLLAWVKLNNLPNTYTILLMPDGERPAALQWMIERTGVLRLAMTNGKRDPWEAAGWDGPVKAPAITADDFGRWVFLASTYNAASGRVVHYRDGRPIGSGTFSQRLPVQFGTFAFGNWPEPSESTTGHMPTGWKTRNFTGCLDDLTIVSRALSAEEIHTLYSQGKP